MQGGRRGRTGLGFPPLIMQLSTAYTTMTTINQSACGAFTRRDSYSYVEMYDDHLNSRELFLSQQHFRWSLADVKYCSLSRSKPSESSTKQVVKLHNKNNKSVKSKQHQNKYQIQLAQHSDN